VVVGGNVNREGGMTPASVLAQVIWQAPAMAPLAVAASAVVTAALLWLYPPQTRGLRRRWRWAMPGLRLLGIAALAAALAQPAVLRPRTAAREGAIVFLADRSRSMSVIDRDRSSAELVSLAAGLGALPAETRIEAAPGL